MQKQLRERLQMKVGLRGTVSINLYLHRLLCSSRAAFFPGDEVYVPGGTPEMVKLPSSLLTAKNGVFNTPM